MKHGLIDNTISRIQSVFRNHPQVEKVILYGSRAKGNFKPGSDIDLTLEGKNLNFDLLNKIRTELDDLLLPYTFDLSNKAEIENKDLLSHIDRVGVVFYVATRPDEH